MYRLVYAARTHSGRVRGNNEDNFYVGGNYRLDIEIQEMACAGEARDGRLLASVCDGMGGHAKGEVASLLAVQTLAELEKEGRGRAFRADPEGCVNRANDRVCEVMRREKVSIGSTISVLEFCEDTVLALNLGDSRIYRMRAGELKQISEDHTVVARMLRMGQITPEEVETHPLRHHITQYLGILPEEVLLEPACTGKMELQPGDRYLICSDGLTDMLNDGQIAAYLRSGTETNPEQQLAGEEPTLRDPGIGAGKETANEEQAVGRVRETESESAKEEQAAGRAREAEPDLEELARVMVQAALDAGGKDNVTVLLVDVRPDRDEAGDADGGRLGKFLEKLKRCREWLEQ